MNLQDGYDALFRLGSGLIDFDEGGPHQNARGLGASLPETKRFSKACDAKAVHFHPIRRTQD
jgi:hypothetical protein